MEPWGCPGSFWVALGRQVGSKTLRPAPPGNESTDVSKFGAIHGGFWLPAGSQNGSKIALFGIISAYDVFVVANNQDKFTEKFGIEADLYSSNISGNGDDVFWADRGHV